MQPNITAHTTEGEEITGELLEEMGEAYKAAVERSGQDGEKICRSPLESADGVNNSKRE